MGGLVRQEGCDRAVVRVNGPETARSCLDTSHQRRSIWQPERLGRWGESGKATVGYEREILGQLANFAAGHVEPEEVWLGQSLLAAAEQDEVSRWRPPEHADRHVGCIGVGNVTTLDIDNAELLEEDQLLNDLDCQLRAVWRPLRVSVVARTGGQLAWFLAIEPEEEHLQAHRVLQASQVFLVLQRRDDADPGRILGRWRSILRRLGVDRHRVGQGRTIGRPGERGRRSPMPCQDSRLAATDADQPHGKWQVTILLGGEHDRRAVRRPGWSGIRRANRGELAGVTAVDVDQPEVARRRVLFPIHADQGIDDR